jgi:predicted RNA-binding Zn-ribbon protein involved in translation (DUF1610 family)
MRNFWENLKNKLAYWMQGRYGYDELNNALSIAFFVLWILSLITKSSVFYYVGLIALGFSLYRSLSRDHIKRSNERLWFLKRIDQIKRLLKQLKQRWEQRNTHKFFRCRQCGVTIRVPKGQGQIEITCPKCGNKFIERT